MNSKRGYIFLGIIVLVSLAVYFFFFKKAPKVVYDFPCGVPKTLVNPLSIDTMMPQFVIDRSCVWKKKILNVYFVDDRITSLTKRKIIDIANEWSIHADISFIRTNDIKKSDIRVMFGKYSGYSSYIGNEADKYINRPTMALGELDKEVNEDKTRSIVLHEFGHALGLLHEMHNPDNPIKWDTVKVYSYFKEYHNMGKAEVDKQVLGQIENTEHSLFDSLSIMTYPIPKKLTLNNISIPMVTELSETDKHRITIYYDN